VDFAKLEQVGVRYQGLEVLGGGATLAGLILGAVTVYIIDREFEKAAAFSAAGMIFTIFGFIHGEAIGWGSSPTVAVGWLGVAAILSFLSRFAEFHPLPVDLHTVQEAEAD
jgi:adenine/guanine/hypoxanthine permease